MGIPMESTASVKYTPCGPPHVKAVRTWDGIMVTFNGMPVMSSTDCSFIRGDIPGDVQMQRGNMIFSQTARGSIELRLSTKARYWHIAGGEVEMIYEDGSRYFKSAAGDVEMTYADGSSYSCSVNKRVTVQLKSGQGVRLWRDADNISHLVL